MGEPSSPARRPQTHRDVRGPRLPIQRWSAAVVGGDGLRAASRRVPNARRRGRAARALAPTFAFRCARRVRTGAVREPTADVGGPRERWPGSRADVPVRPARAPNGLKPPEFRGGTAARHGRPLLDDASASPRRVRRRLTAVALPAFWARKADRCSRGGSRAASARRRRGLGGRPGRLPGARRGCRRCAPTRPRRCRLRSGEAPRRRPRA